MLHCNRCGRSFRELVPEAPPPEMGAALAGRSLGDEAQSSLLVCSDCLGLGGPYRFCARCGQETPAAELRAGYCDWCRGADEIPFEEPADEAWWEGKVPGANPPAW